MHRIILLSAALLSACDAQPTQDVGRSNQTAASAGLREPNVSNDSVTREIEDAREANAGPVYLQCPMALENGQGAVNFELTLNEETGNAGFIIEESGHSRQNLPAIFTAAKVKWSERSGQYEETRYSVDRTTLEFVEQSYVGGRLIMTRNGTCKTSSVGDRKF